MADVTEAVSGGMKLTDQQVMGLKYYNDLIQPVPREEANLIKDIVVKELDSIQRDCVVELVGGYRRGKASGHDVDILITHADESKAEGLLLKLVERLDKLGHMCHKDVMVGRNPQYETKSSHPKNVTTQSSQRQGHMDQLDHCFCMFQVKATQNKPEEVLRNEGLRSLSPSSLVQQETSAKDAATSTETGCSAVRRVDLIVTSPKQFTFALLGWTGSKQFNRSLRDYAWKMLKIKLSNHGMWDYHHAPPHQIEAKSEHEIFSALQLDYREPEDRNA